MGKLLGLDIGTKRIGYAMSDPEGKIAFPRGVFEKTPFSRLLRELRRLVEMERISKLIIGLPLDIENQEGQEAIRLRKFGEKLGRALKVSVAFIDESGSTREALSKIPFRKDRKQRGKDDAIAAQIILQRYLESQEKSI